ncbi:hypothetical protein HPB50_017812 [Hyalomma asiaticum]|uniref:Uncharacterized protein n=1 Tax=Hyalomma asiaticum TaxID=266040 RepID=A0ACB7T3F2_HYAAI|nr:hypothetical protein HPB50_017812 [Hyalomma asiaticum]
MAANPQQPGANPAQPGNPPGAAAASPGDAGQKAPAGEPVDLDLMVDPDMLPPEVIDMGKPIEERNLVEHALEYNPHRKTLEVFLMLGMLTSGIGIIAYAVLSYALVEAFSPLHRQHPPTTSFTGLAPPPYFFPMPGRPSLPWEQWEQMFNVYILTGIRSRRIQAGATQGYSFALFGGRPAPQHQVPQHPPMINLSRPFLTNTILHSLHYGTSFLLRPTLSSSVIASAAAAKTQANDALRDQFVAGVASNRVRERLLFEGSTLFFENSVRIALQFEQAAEELKEVEAISLRQRRKPSSHSAQKSSSQPAAPFQQTLTRSTGGSRAPQRNRPPERNREQSSRSSPSPSTPSRSPGIRQQQTTSPSIVRRPKRPTRERRPPAWLRDYQTDYVAFPVERLHTYMTHATTYATT